MRKINWKATLNNIVYNHKYDTVEFNVKDIEKLVSYLAALEEERDNAVLVKTALKNELNTVKGKLLAAQFTTMTDNASSFIEYA